ncbi:MAG: hypothetical protein SGJ19_19305 [Planctomycetia bacterium]|nr:hypothetical protein [Planctomycetia bacterium]
MPRDASTPDPLSGFEKQLQSLRPTAALGRDQLMFRAGQASVERGVTPRRWWLLAATNGISALAAGLLVAMTMQPEPRAEEQVVERPAPPAPPAPAIEAPPVRSADAEFGYLALRNRAIQGDWREPLVISSNTGWEKSAATPSYRQLLEQYSQELR